MKSKFFLLSSLLVCCMVCFGGCENSAAPEAGFEKKDATETEKAIQNRDEKKVEAPPA